MKKILFILLMPLFCISQTVVNGNYNYTGKMQFSKYKNNLAKDSVLTVDTSGRLILKKFSGATGNTSWTDSSGYLFPTTLENNVGIGTATPDQKLVVTQYGFDNIKYSANGFEIRNNWDTYDYPKLKFFEDWFERTGTIQLTGNGLQYLSNAHYFDSRVGIGITSPSYALDIDGSTRISNGNSHFVGTGGQNMARGSFDNGTSGDNGISLNCAAGYELNWQGGHLSSSQSGGVYVPIVVDSTLQLTGLSGQGNGTVGVDNNGKLQWNSSLWSQDATGLYPADTTKFVGIGTTQPISLLDVQSNYDGGSLAMYIGDLSGFGLNKNQFVLNGGTTTILADSTSVYTNSTSVSTQATSVSTQATSVSTQATSVYTQADSILIFKSKLISFENQTTFPDFVTDSAYVNGNILFGGVFFGNNTVSGGSSISANYLYTGSSSMYNNTVSGGYGYGLIPGIEFNYLHDHCKIDSNSVLGNTTIWDIDALEDCSVTSNYLYNDSTGISTIDAIRQTKFDHVDKDTLIGFENYISILSMLGNSSISNNHLEGNRAEIQNGILAFSNLNYNQLSSTEKIKNFSIIKGSLNNKPTGISCENFFLFNKDIDLTGRTTDFSNRAEFGGLVTSDSLQVNNLGGNGNGIVGVDNNGLLSWQNIDSINKGFIPLTGTASGNPVTGNIKIDAIESAQTRTFYSGDNTENSYFAKLFFADDGQIGLLHSNNENGVYKQLFTSQTGGWMIGSNDPTAKGLIGQQDFTANITDLDYTQKIYVDTAIATALSATPRVVASGQKSQALVAATTISVTIGATEPSTAYQVTVTPTSALSAALFYVDNKTTTTFDVVYLAGITGTVQFDWSVIR